jgi:hypothetical protein
MAPGLTESLPQAPHTLFNNHEVPTDLFPDGIKTSGQLPPIYEQLKPYDAFPKEISGPTVWKAEDYKDVPERWTHRFSSDEIAELSAAADKFIADGIPLTGITKVG